MATPAGHTRAARSYLRKTAKAGTSDIPPGQFAAAASEQHSSFDGVLNFLKYYYATGDEKAEMRHDQLNGTSPTS